MAGIYNRETLFQKNIVDDVKEVDMGSIDFPELDEAKVYSWTTVRDQEYCRPDLVSYRLYGTDELWWFVMWLNGISDPYLPIDKINNAFKYRRIKS